MSWSICPVCWALAISWGAWCCLEGARQWSAAQVEVARLRLQEAEVQLYRDTVTVARRRPWRP